MLLLCFVGIGQSLLTKEEAVELALESNFDIVQANQSVLIEENNTSIYNSGYLPTLTGNANIAYNIDNTNAEFLSGETAELEGAKSDNRSASLNLNWVAFDGFNRKYSIDRNQVNYTISQLNALATLEVVLLDLLASYYEVARLQESVASLQQTLDISKERLYRTSYSFEYGRSNRLDISNAEVAVNTDSINLLNAYQSLESATRNLKFIMARDADQVFTVDTLVSFVEIPDKNSLLSKLRSKNTQILLAKAGLIVNEYNTQISKSSYLPSLVLNGGYNYRLSNNNAASPVVVSEGNGVTYGATLSWNLFDGGATKTAVQNARINQTIQENAVRQATQQAILNFENAWGDYQNRLFVVKAQRSSLNANQLNFQRTEEQYKLGRVTSLDFRTAQQNLLQSKLTLIEARYNAKIAELTLFQLVGEIQQANF